MYNGYRRFIFPLEEFELMNCRKCGHAKVLHMPKIGCTGDGLFDKKINEQVYCFCTFFE